MAVGFAGWLAGGQRMPAAQGVKPAQVVVEKAGSKGCTAAVMEGDVVYGQSVTWRFTPGLEFKLEAIASGWIVRVLPVGKARPPQDDAELATLPYRSVTPLAVSTDFAFRAQDAVAWNPRRFRYAGTREAAERLATLYPAVLANDAQASAEAAVLSQQQPSGELQLLSAELAPGTADQWKMAAAVASHLQSIPHEVAQGVAASPLGKITKLRFRVRMQLPKGAPAGPGVTTEKVSCAW